MENEAKKRTEKDKRPAGTTVMYIAAVFAALIAVALLINNIIFFNNIVSQYVEQGYDSADVLRQLIPTQLLPGIFEPVAVYGGIALILYGIGMINRKITKYPEPSPEDRVQPAAPEENGVFEESMETDEESADEASMEADDGE